MPTGACIPHWAVVRLGAGRLGFCLQIIPTAPVSPLEQSVMQQTALLMFHKGTPGPVDTFLAMLVTRKCQAGVLGKYYS